MLKNIDLGRRRAFAVSLGLQLVVGLAAFAFVQRWWTLSAAAALCLPVSVVRAARFGFARWLALLTLIPGVGIVIAAVFLLAEPIRRADDVDSRRSSEPRLTTVALGVVTTAAIGVVFTFLSANVLDQYGWALFVSLPFVLGLVSAVLATAHGDQPTATVLATAAGATMLAGLALVLLSLEGVICLIMALPLALPLAAIGALTAQALRWMQHAGAFFGIGVLVPALLAGELFGGPSADLHRVTTHVVVAAPPQVVWRHVVSFPPLPAPDDLSFRLGVAYPVGAEIDGRGAGAIRRCRFSTGDFVEPITTWDKPKRLAFDVLAQPAPMKELSPYGAVHAPHLTGFLRSERGEFRLVPLQGGRTMLIGTTWYRNRMWPADYWTLWSDVIIQRIHRRVLEHVQRLAEGRS